MATQPESSSGREKRIMTLLNTVYPEYFKVQNIHGFSAEKGFLNFRILIVHFWLKSHEYIECGHPLVLQGVSGSYSRHWFQ